LSGLAFILGLKGIKMEDFDKEVYGDKASPKFDGYDINHT
jgi:hypothetical protein